MPNTGASEFLGTPSVFVVGKNYRLQDIQLSKSNGVTFPRRMNPTAFRLQLAQKILPPAKTGGEYRARTGDLLDANQALSQLS